MSAETDVCFSGAHERMLNAIRILVTRENRNLKPCRTPSHGGTRPKCYPAEHELPMQRGRVTVEGHRRAVFRMRDPCGGLALRKTNPAKESTLHPV